MREAILILWQPTLVMMLVDSSENKNTIKQFRKAQYSTYPSKKQVINSIDKFRADFNISCNTLGIFLDAFEGNYKAWHGSLDEPLDAFTRIYTPERVFGGKVTLGGQIPENICMEFIDRKEDGYVLTMPGMTEYSVGYLSDLYAGYVDRIVPGTAGFLLFQDVPRLILVNKSEVKIILANVSISAVLGRLASTAGVPFKVVRNLFMQIGNTRDKASLELLRKDKVSSEHYYGVIDSIYKGLTGFQITLDKLHTAVPNATIAVAGDYSQVIGLEHFVMNGHPLGVSCVVPARVETGGITAGGFERENFTSIAAIRLWNGNRLNFAPVKELSVIEPEIEEVPVVPVKQIQSEVEVPVAEPVTYTQMPPLVTPERARVAMQQLNGNTGTVEANKRVTVPPAFSVYVEDSAETAENVVPVVPSTAPVAINPSDIVVDDTSNTERNEGRTLSREFRDQKVQEFKNYLTNSSLEVTSLGPNQGFQIDETVAVNAEQLPASIESPAMQAFINANQNIHSRNKFLTSSIFVIGLMVCLIGLFMAFTTKGPVEYPSIGELTSQEEQLRTDIQIRKYYDKLQSGGLEKYLPYMEYIGSLQGSSTEITDFNLIGVESLVINGDCTTQSEFEQFRQALNGVSAEMNVTLQLHEVSEDKQTFSFAITPVEVSK